MYRAIGKYRVDARDEEKIRALKETLCDAAIELADLRISMDAIEDAFDDAYSAAEQEWEYIENFDRKEAQS